MAAVAQNIPGDLQTAINNGPESTSNNEVPERTVQTTPKVTEKDTTSERDSAAVAAVSNSNNGGSRLPKKYLREWKPMYELLSRVPKYATRGQNTVKIKLTCVAVVDEFIALGTNVGLVYWYNRKIDNLGRVRTDVPTSITKLCIVSSVDYMLAAGNVNGLIAIFQIPKVHSQAGSDLDFLTKDETPCARFLVSELHQSPITALEWSKNGMKLFSGDSEGIVGLTDVDYNSEETNSQKLLTEGTEITQLSYDKKCLLVCSLSRSIIYSVETKSVIRIGTQERKIEGTFGGLFLRRSLNDPPRLYSVRPNGRVWVVDSSGTVELTIKFKDLFVSKNYPTIPLVTTQLRPQDSLGDFQIGILHRYLSTYLVSSYKNLLFILNPSPVETEIVAVCDELSGLIDVATNDKEIFILESDRTLRRVSYEYDDIQTLQPENYYTDFKKAVESLPGLISASIPKQPISYFTSKLKETSRALPTALRSTIKNVIEFNVDIQDGELTVPPNVIPLKFKDIPDIQTEEGIKTEEALLPPEINTLGVIKMTATTTPTPTIEDKFKHISAEPFEEVVVVQPLRRNKKRKQKKTKNSEKLMNKSLGNKITTSDAISLCSIGSTNSEGDGRGLRKLSVHSDSPQVLASSADSSTNSEAQAIKESTSSQLNLFFSGKDNMSQSWSAGQMEETVSAADLEAKEEILARRLKWRELLPSSAQDSILDDEFKDQSKIAASQSEENPTEKETIKTSQSDFSVYTDYFSQQESESSEFSSGVSTLKPSYSNSELYLSSLRQLEANGSLNMFSNSAYTQEECDISSLNVFEDSVDIYSMYAPQDEPTESLKSRLSFGPPSGTNSLMPEQEEEEEEVEAGPVKPTISGTISAAYEDLMQVRDMIVDPMVIENDSWSSYSVPFTPVHISCCDKFALVTDNKTNVHYSPISDHQLSFTWSQTEYQANVMGLSPCGSVLWRLHKNVLYSLTNGTPDDPAGLVINCQWSKLASNVISMAVHKQGTGWIVKTDGTVFVACNVGLGGSKTKIPDFKKVPCSYPIAQITARDTNVWCVTLDGQLIYRTSVTDYDPVGLDWSEKSMEIDVPLIHSVALGPLNSVWVADIMSNVYFISNPPVPISICDSDKKKASSYSGALKVTFGEFTNANQTRRSPSPGRKSPMPGGGAETSSSSSSFSFTSIRRQISDTLRPDRLNNLLSSKSKFPMLAGCESSIWFSTTVAKELQVCKTMAEGHAWSVVKLQKPIKGTTWLDIFAGNIYNDYGYLWLLDSKGKLFYSKPQSEELRPVDLPCSSKILALTPAPDALWILNSEGVIFSRCNITAVNPIGHGWDKIDTSTLGDSQLIHVSCGSDVAWGCDVKGRIFLRVGSLKPPEFGDISPVWLEVEGFPSSQDNCVFNQVYVGSNGNMVWAVDNFNNVYVREAVYPDYPIGTKWLMVAGVEAVKLSLSDQAVWTLSRTGEIYKRHGVSNTNFVGDYWKKVLGNVKTITASVCDQLWALDSSGQLLKHNHAILNFREKAEMKKQKTSLDPEDKDWELVDSL